jgi:hypothetical protein
MKLIYGPLEPDKPQHMQEGLQQADNVYPASNGYRPVRAFGSISDALPETFQGGATYVASDLTVNLLAGTATDLYRFDASLEWSSILGTLTAGRWYFTQANDHAIGTYGGAPVDIDLTAGTAAALSGSPPSSDYCATCKGFVILGAASTVTWSGFEDRAEWTAGTNQSGSQPMLEGGPITGLAGGEYFLVFQRSAITRGTYVGPDPIWQFDVISANIGCTVAGSIASAGRMHFFLSDRGFMMTDGNDVKPIGAERVDRTFAETYAANDLELMYACVDPKNHLVIWTMPGKQWVYNYQLDQWATWTWDVRATFNGYAQGVSLDDLDAIFTNLDLMGDISLDDARFQGGAPLLLAINSANEVGTMTGDNLAATLQPPFIELVEGRAARISQVRPIGDATSGLTVQFNARQRLGDTGSSESFATQQDSGDIDCRVSGRFVRPIVTIAAGTAWSYFQGLYISMMAGGGRR